MSAPAEALSDQPLHPKIRSLLDYWTSIRPGKHLPGRQHFDPLDVPRLLPNIWLVDVEETPARRLRYRLVGTNVARAFDADPTGHYLEETNQDSRDHRVRKYLHKVARDRLPAWRIGKPMLWLLQDHLWLERIYLPMATDGETVDMILALTVFRDRFGTEY